MSIVIFLLILVFFIVYMVFKAHHDTIDYRTIYDQQLPISFNGFRVFFISDIHSRKISVNTLKSINKQIDIVTIGGDLTEKGVPLERTRSNLRKLSQLGAPVYFVWGNHDYESSPDQLYKLLIEENVTILADTYVDINKGNCVISLFGFNYYRSNDDRIEMDWERSKGTYSILLTHTPSSFYDLTPVIKNKVHTVLAGHTHGGQIRIFNFGFYQKGGISSVGKTKVFISEGYGYTLLPFRLQTSSECHVITFKNKVSEHISSIIL